MAKKMNDSKTLWWSRHGWIVAVITIIALALRGLANNYLPDVHDITPLIWGQAFFEGVQSGWLYPVWLPQIWYGFGLPVFQFYTPLYYWVTAIFQSMGLDVLYSSKVVLALSLIGGWWFMYLWAREFLNKSASILSASLFIWAPYYLSLIYTRGAFPEFFALSMVPLLFWTVTRLMKYKNVLYFGISTAILSILLLSHTLTSGLAIGLVLLYAVYLYFFEEGFKTNLWPVVGSMVLAGFLTAFHWFPAIVSTGLINTDILISGNFAYFANFIKFSELLNLWSNADWSWKTLGIVQLATIGIAIIGYREILNRIWARRIAAFGIVILMLLFLTLPASDFIWNNLPLLEYLQFPSRLLGPIVLLTAFLAGMLLETFFQSNKNQIFVVGGILLITVLIYWPHTYVGPNRFEQEKNLNASELNVFDYLDKTIFSAQAKEQPDIFFDRGIFSFEYLPRKMPISDARVMAGATLTEANERYLVGESPRFTKIETDDDIQIKTISEKFVNFEYKIIANEAGRIRINQFEFPTWEILLDKKPAEPIIELDEPGQFLDIPQGTHSLTIDFKHLPIVIWSRVFSGIVLLLTIIGLIWFKNREKYSKLGKYGKTTKNKKN